ncbi:MAG: aminoglycoside phosphotransferase family protein, partial [Actinomycetota bacterium]
MHSPLTEVGEQRGRGAEEFGEQRGRGQRSRGGTVGDENAEIGARMPAADVAVDDQLVRRLLESQHPDLARLELVEVANGWDNVMFRLDDELVVRLPRRAAAGRLVAHEIAALPQLAHRLPLPVPAPVRVGAPDGEYPHVWAVLPWFDGAPLGSGDLDEPAAESLAGFFTALHTAAPADAPINPFRGHFIGENDERFCTNVDSLGARWDQLVDGGRARVIERWRELIDVPPHAGPPVWLHGDLHTLNVLVDGGRITAIVDWGDVTSGDPAVDRALCRTRVGPTEPEGGRNPTRADAATWPRAHPGARYFAAPYHG